MKDQNMLNRRSFALALAVALFSSISHSGTLLEDFSSNPSARGWQVWGDTNLFSWAVAEESLNATWNSSTSNSYFYHSLGTVLARDDDFALSFDLRLHDIATTTKPGPFQIAVGLVGFAEATRSDYWRGTGVNAQHGPRNVCEFDYFPAGYYPDFGDVAPSVSPTVVSSDNIFSSGFDLLELTNNETYHVEMVYISSNSVLRTTLSLGGQNIGPLGEVQLVSNFTDFRLDTVAVCSYSDAGDDFDSVLAHGTVDNLVLTLPPPPLENLTSSWSNGVYVVEFGTRTNWNYTLDRSINLADWNPISTAVVGTGTNLSLQDVTPPAPAAFYRVTANHR